MYHRRRLGVIALFAGLFLWVGSGGAEPLYAQNKGNPVADLQKQFEADSTRPSSSADLVSVDLRLAATPVPAGESVRAAAVLTVEDGWHVNAHQPTYDYLIGTALDWELPSDVTVENVHYPRPKRLELGFVEDAIEVYEGTAPIYFDVRSASVAAPGERRLTGRLRVQACNDQTCLRPSTVRASLRLPIASGGASAEPTGDPVFEDAPVSTPGASTLMPILQQYGLLIAGGVLVLGTALFLLLASVAESQEESE
jgi:thiol:disulfide interchange protein DsbD